MKPRLTEEQKKERKRKYQQDNSHRNAEYHQRWVENNPESALITFARCRAKKKGVPFSISKEDIKVPELCPILGIPLKFNYGKGAGFHADSPSIDRKDPSLGYVPGNVWVVSNLANNMKATASKDQIILFAKWVLENMND